MSSKGKGPRRPGRGSGPRDYEVGYGKPPRHSQWKPGQSGNPKGRPKQMKDVTALLHEALYRPVTMTQNGRRRRMPLVQVLVEGLIRLSVKGDPKARRDLFKLLDRHPGAAKRQELFRLITPDMSPQEAADAYRATLRAIDGVIDPDEG